MSNQNPAVSTAYGAFELKATYQRNMLLGNMVTILLVILLTGVMYGYSYLFPPPIKPPINVDPPRKVIFMDTLTIKPIKEPPLGGNRGRKVVKPPLFGTKPVPVADNLLTEDLTIPTNEERKDLNFYYLGIPGEDERTTRDIFSQPGIAGGEILPYGTFIKHEVPPEMIYEEKPVYPRNAKKGGFEAVVWIAAYVGEDGRVQEAKVVESSGSRAGFDEAAVASAYKCIYKPAIQNGFNIGVWVTYKVEFKLR